MNKITYVSFKDSEDTRIDIVWVITAVDWLRTEGIDYSFGSNNNKETGVYLDERDAIVFKLKFGL